MANSFARWKMEMWEKIVLAIRQNGQMLFAPFLAGRVIN